MLSKAQITELHIICFSSRSIVFWKIPPLPPLTEPEVAAVAAGDALSITLRREQDVEHSFTPLELLFDHEIVNPFQGVPLSSRNGYSFEGFPSTWTRWSNRGHELQEQIPFEYWVIPSWSSRSGGPAIYQFELDVRTIPPSVENNQKRTRAFPVLRLLGMAQLPPPTRDEDSILPMIRLGSPNSLSLLHSATIPTAKPISTTRIGGLYTSESDSTYNLSIYSMIYHHQPTQIYPQTSPRVKIGTTKWVEGKVLAKELDRFDGVSVCTASGRLAYQVTVRDKDEELSRSAIVVTQW